MRKLTSLLAFLAIALSSWAQGWTVVSRQFFNDETIVYVALQNQADGQAIHTDEWAVGAFIGQECRGEATTPAEGPDGSFYYVLRVFGDHETDTGRPIDFLVCHKTTQALSVGSPSRPVSFSGESEGVPSAPVLLSFAYTPGGPVALQGFSVSVDSVVTGQTGQLRLVPVPADASFNPFEVQPQFIGRSFPSWADAITYERTSLSPLTFSFTSQVPQRYVLTAGATPLYLDGTSEAFSDFEVGAPLQLHEGWQWVTNYYGSISTQQFSAVYGGNALTELRTQRDLLYNDPAFGYYGTLFEAGLPQNTPYQALMAADHESSLWQGTFQDNITINVNEGWQWMPSPYYFDCPLADAFSPEQLCEGLAIVSKADGLAEWDGTEWVGNLQTLATGQAYLLYCEKDTMMELTTAPAASTGPSTSGQALPRWETTKRPIASEATDASPFNLSPSLSHRFRDNLAVVARMDQLADASDYALMAFVGDECRGVGSCAKGRFFITVQCDAGERISFRLCHLSSGRQAGVSETLRADGQPRQGSLRRPVVLHAPEAITGIAPVATDKMSTTYYYDLSGRRRATARAGVVIERHADGSTRLVVR